MGATLQNGTSTTQDQSPAQNRPGKQQSGGKQEEGTSPNLEGLSLGSVKETFENFREKALRTFKRLRDDPLGIYLDLIQEDGKAPSPTPPTQQANQALQAGTGVQTNGRSPLNGTRGTNPTMCQK